MELLSGPAARPPVVATGIGDVESLERRLTRIISPEPRQRAPRGLVLATMSLALALTAFGFGAHADTASDAAAGTASGALDPRDLRDMQARGVGAPMAEASAEERYATVSGTFPAASAARDGLIAGTAAGDSITGTAADDTIVGGAGADELKGGSGRDVIRGGPGGDTIWGGAGRDVIHAGAGNDVVRTWRDGVADQVDCGSGQRDRAVIDDTDSARRCEVVVIRDPA